MLANLIYSGSKVLDMFVEGEAIRRDGVTLTIDEEIVSNDLEDAVLRYYEEI